MKHLICIFLLLLNFAASAQTLTRLWETEPLMDKPESAVYDRANKVIYVSNINGKYCTKDGNGYLSKVALDGTILNLNWITGLDSPQGLTLFRNHLYVADVDQVIVIDIQKGIVEKRFIAEGAIFLNDIAADTNGNVYVSDCKANRIYRLKNNRLDVWLSDSKLQGPNGLFCERKKLMLLNMGEGTIYRVDKKTKALTGFCSGIKNLDGVVPAEKGGYFVSGAWQGEVYHLDSKGEKRLTLNLGAEKVIAADIEYIPEKQLLIVPTLSKTVMGYRWE
jgi:DNA-binding beta-propeller fold protein YncE